MDKALKEKDLGRKQFSPKDISIMIDWLQEPKNLECVKGTDGKTKVGARYPNKKQAFAAMASYINKNQNRGSDLQPIETQGARNRYTHQMKRYKNAKIAQESTGWGLTPADASMGINTIEAKLEKICPCFARWDVLMDGVPEVDIGGNLFNAGSVPNPDGSVPVDILTHAATPTDEDSNVGGLEDTSNCFAGPSQRSPLPTPCTREQVIDLDSESPQPPPVARTIPASPVVAPTYPSSPSLNGGAEDSDMDEGAPQSTTTSQPNPSTYKQKPSRFPASKKRPQDRAGGLSGVFSSSLESLSEGKLQGNVIRERALEAKLAAAEHDRAMRIHNAQRQLDLDASKIRHEEKRLEHSAVLEAKRLKHSHQAEERKIELQEKKAKVQARIALMKVNRHRTLEEIEKLLSMMESNI